MHTPGPWVVHSAGPHAPPLRSISRGDNDIAFILLYGDVGYGENAATHDVDANANLVAAAPELLAALEEVEWVDTGITGEDFWMQCPWCLKFKTTGHAEDCPRQLALGKARGE